MRLLSLSPFVIAVLSGPELVASQTLVPPPFSDTSLYSSDSTTTTSDSTTTTDIDTGSITSPTDSASVTDSDTNLFSSTTTSTSSDTGITPPPISPSSPSTSFPSSSTSSTGSGTGLGTSSGSSSSSNAGAIAGGVVGGLVALAAIAGIIFLLMRRRRRRLQNGGTLESPPSPRLKSPWLGSIRGSIVGGVTGGATRPSRGQRLGSVGGDSSPPSNLGHGGGGGGGGGSLDADADAHELELGSVVSRQAPAAGTTAGGETFTRATPSTTRMNRNRSSVSRTSAGEEAFGAGATGHSARSSYDLNVFSSSNGAGNGMQRGASSSRQTNASNPFASDASIDASSPYSYAAGTAATTTGSGASEISRHASTTRLARKPAPKYEGDAETATNSPTTPTSPYGTAPRGSKPPVSGLARTRTYSNSSSQRARGVNTASAASGTGTGNGSNSSRSSFENPQLTHKSSQGTLGGAFKFAGEKEGVTHFLIPDPPPPGSS